MKVLYTTSATAYGARVGRVVSDDDRLEVDLSVPASLGGDDGDGTNPEQLFAAGYASCFFSAMRYPAGTAGVSLENATITVKVSLGKPADAAGFRLAVDLEAKIPGQSEDTVLGLIEATHQICPYSHATRGNVEVTFTALGE